MGAGRLLALSVAGINHGLPACTAHVLFGLEEAFKQVAVALDDAVAKPSNVSVANFWNGRSGLRSLLQEQPDFDIGFLALCRDLGLVLVQTLLDTPTTQKRRRAQSIDVPPAVKGRTTDVDASFIDILQHTEIPKDLIALMGYSEARNGRLSLFADIIYMKIGLGAGLTRTRGVDALNGAIGASAGLTERMLIAQVAAAYEIAQWGSTGAPGSGTAIDLYGGVRGWWQQGDVKLALSGTLNIGDLTLNADRTLTASGSVGWVDPLVGVRLRHQLATGVNFIVSGDIGGFDIGSKFSWQALAAVNYDFYVRDGVTWSGMLGYRALYVDYSQGAGLTRYQYKMTMYGPMLGVTARF